MALHEEWAETLSSVRLVGAQYPEDYDTESTPSIAATYYSASPTPVIVGLLEGRAYHFWPSGTKPLVASSGLRTVLLAFEAKQISASGANIDDEVGTIVAAAGFDWWPSPGATTGNSEAVHGSFKAVNTSWRSFYVTTARTALMLDCPLFPALAQLTQTGEPGVDPDFVAP